MSGAESMISLGFERSVRPPPVRQWIRYEQMNEFILSADSPRRLESHPDNSEHLPVIR